MLDTAAAFERLVCLAHVVLAEAQVDAWYRASFDERPPIEAQLKQLVTPLVDGTLASSPNEKRLGARYAEMWSAAERRNAAWRMESAVMLDWALGLRDELPPFDVETTDSSFLEALVAPSSRAEKREQAQLRSREELDVRGSDASDWWRRASAAKPLFSALMKPTSTLSAKKKEKVRSAIGEPAELFGKPYAHLTLAEMSTAFSIAIERFKAIDWLLTGIPWDEAKPEASALVDAQY